MLTVSTYLLPTLHNYIHTHSTNCIMAYTNKFNISSNYLSRMLIIYATHFLTSCAYFWGSPSLPKVIRMKKSYVIYFDKDTSKELSAKAVTDTQEK